MVAQKRDRSLAGRSEERVGFPPWNSVFTRVRSFIFTTEDTEEHEGSRDCSLRDNLRSEQVFFSPQCPQFPGFLHRYADGVAEQRIERVDPEHLPAKNRAEVGRGGLSDGRRLDP